MLVLPAEASWLRGICCSMVMSGPWFRSIRFRFGVFGCLEGDPEADVGRIVQILSALSRALRADFVTCRLILTLPEISNHVSDGS